MYRIGKGTLWLLLCLTLSASVSANPNDEPRIQVSGEGSVSLAPDIAHLHLSVAREAVTAADALKANSQAMNEVLDALKDMGIAERDMQTSNFAIEPRYRYPQPGATGKDREPRIVGYIVRNSLAVTVRDLERVGEVLDRSVTLGVNEGGQIQFDNEDPSEALSQARTKAVQNAIAKATTLTLAAGVKTGRILEISERAHQPYPTPMARRANLAMAESADSVPVAAGENRYRVQVNVSFAIEQ